MLFEIILLISFLVVFTVAAFSLGVALPFPSPEEQEDMGVNLRGQGR